MIYVTNDNDNTVSVIDGKTNSVVNTVHVGKNPDDITVNSNTNMIYVDNVGSNMTSVIDGKTNALVTTVRGHEPYGVAVNLNTTLSSKDIKIHGIRS